jgi:putative tricarboxylic transport membrane protein
MKEGMKKPDMGTSALLFCVGLFILFYAPEFELGTMSLPGPGFMPFCTGILICAFSIFTFFQALFSPKTAGEKIWAGVRFQKLFLVLGALVIYSLLFKPLGFLLSTFILIFVLMRYIEPQRQSWVFCFLGGFFSSGLSYLLFEIWLKAQLPKGIFGF